MGINANGLRFLLLAKAQGVDFSRTAMVGRQGIHIDLPLFTSIMQEEFHCQLGRAELARIQSAGYAEPLLEWLGAELVHSFDYSNYEGATYEVDFNTPIPDQHKSNYTVVIDGGTIEHVFHFSTALKNCMEMVSLGGAFITSVAANNEMGHGFYQTSPELYFRALAPENGFQVEELYLHEGRENRVWLKVTDPDHLRRRVSLINTIPTSILARATRIGSEKIFARPPLQSDYTHIWSPEESAAASTQAPPLSNMKRLWKTIVPARLRASITIVRVGIRAKVDRLRILAGVGRDRAALTPFIAARRLPAAEQAKARS